MPKLTLDLPSITIRQARTLAAKQGESISNLFARFIAIMAARRRMNAPMGHLTHQLSGIISLPPHQTARAVVTDILLERHGIHPEHTRRAIHAASHRKPKASQPIAGG
jgi:hypothetical protein